MYHIQYKECMVSTVGETEGSLRAGFMEDRRLSIVTTEESNYVHIDNPNRRVSLEYAKILVVECLHTV